MIRLRYTDTQLYKSMVAAAEADIAMHTEIHDRLVGIRMRGPGAIIEKRKKTPEEATAFKAAIAGIKSAQERLDCLLNLTAPTYDLLHILMHADMTLWTPDEVTQWNKEMLDQTEGRGEEALKLRYGIPSNSSTKECDLIMRDSDGKIVLYEEVKSLQEKSKPTMQEIQTGARGRHLYGMWLLENAEREMFKHLHIDLRIALGTGELTSKCIENLPPYLNESIMKEMMPSNVLGIYSAVNGTTTNGFIWIPRHHFDEAWAFTHVTKSGPKFALRKSYVVWRLQRTLDRPKFEIETSEELVSLFSSETGQDCTAQAAIVSAMSEKIKEELDQEIIGVQPNEKYNTWTAPCSTGVYEALKQGVNTILIVDPAKIVRVPTLPLVDYKPDVVVEKPL